MEFALRATRVGNCPEERKKRFERLQGDPRMIRSPRIDSDFFGLRNPPLPFALRWLNGVAFRTQYRALNSPGVEVRVNSRVEEIDAEGVVVNGERIAAATVLWAAGVTASPAAAWLGQEPDKAARLRVGSDLSVPGMPDVFAIGDTALAIAWDGEP